MSLVSNTNGGLSATNPDGIDITDSKLDNLNTVQNTRDHMNTLIDEIEALSK